jgi:hypothetical protein
VEEPWKKECQASDRSDWDCLNFVIAIGSNIGIAMGIRGRIVKGILCQRPDVVAQHDQRSQYKVALNVF